MNKNHIKVLANDHRIEQYSINHLNHYLFKQKDVYTCSHCGTELEEDYAKCPSCNVELKTKRIQSNTNFDNMYQEFWFDVLEVHKSTIMLRSYIVSKDIVNLKERIYVDEVQRQVLENGQYYTYHQWIDNAHNWHWNTGLYRDNWSVFRKQRTSFALYPNDMKTFLSDTELKYTHIWDFIYPSDNINLIFSKLKYATKYKWIELLYKQNMKALYNDIIHGHADMRTVKPNIIKEYRKLIAERNLDALELYVQRRMEKLGYREYDNRLMSLSSYKPYYTKLLSLSNKIKRHPMKIVDYVNVQKEKDIVVLIDIGYYDDYIRMLVKTNRLADNDTLLFPNDLIKAHNDEVELYNTMQLNLKSNAYKKVLKRIDKLAFEKDGLMIVAPKTIGEIVQEGKNLNNCVATYTDRVLRGETVILFVRKKDAPEESYYCLEYKSKSIIQCRGNRNTNMTDEVKEFTDIWINQVKKGVNNDTKRIKN